MYSQDEISEWFDKGWKMFCAETHPELPYIDGFYQRVDRVVAEFERVIGTYGVSFVPDLIKIARNQISADYVIWQEEQKLILDTIRESMYGGVTNYQRPSVGSMQVLPRRK